MSRLLSEAAHAMARQAYEQAVKLSTEHLVAAPGDFDGLHLLGIALCHCGKVDEGRREVEKAMALRPDHPDPYYNLGTTLLRLHEWDAAKAYLNKAIALAPNHYSAWNSLGLLHMHEGQPTKAAQAYRKAVRLEPRFAGAWRNLASALTELNDRANGIEALQSALRLEPDHRDTMQALGRLLVEEGRLAEAKKLIEKSLSAGGQSADLLQILGALCIQLTDYKSAEHHLLEALTLDPDLHLARDDLGVALSNLGRPKEARACHEAVLQAQPSNARALGHLAELLEMSNEVEAANELVDRGLEKFPQHPVLNLVKARCERRQKGFGAALVRLRRLTQASLPEAPYLRAMHFELGRCYDATGDFGSAMDAFSRGNELALKAWHAGNVEDDPMLPAADHLRRNFLSSHQPRARIGGSSAPRLAFVQGFQRSGTTLLDTVLDAHSQVQVVEESPALMNTANRFARSHPYPQGLADLGTADLAQLRSHYLRGLQAVTHLDEKKLLVDKAPLNLVHLGLIQSLFPDAPVILLIRDPRDVCLSCFMQDFELSPFTVRFCSLAETSQAYAQIMALQLHYESQLVLNLICVRYEDLVEDFEGQVGRVLEHIGLLWEPGLKEFHQHARQRGLVRTPSYHQISQPIYGTSIGRWRSYAKHMGPVEPHLAPYIKHYGYAA